MASKTRRDSYFEALEEAERFYAKTMAEARRVRLEAITAANRAYEESYIAEESPDVVWHPISPQAG